jgi:hypothetical protein
VVGTAARRRPGGVVTRTAGGPIPGGFLLERRRAMSAMTTVCPDHPMSFHGRLRKESSNA